MNAKSAIESILFIHGEPLTVSRIAKVISASPAAVKAALGELASERRECGIVLIENDGEWQLATNPANRVVVEKLISGERSGDLSRAALEVLAVIAYKSPISRAGIEHIRGVDSSFTLRNLLIRGLVSREEHPTDRRSYRYRISTDFLKHLGLSRPSELPDYDALRQAPLPTVPSKIQAEPQDATKQRP